MIKKPKQSKKGAMTIEDLAALIQQDFLAIRKDMATKEDIKAIRAEMATKEDLRQFRAEVATRFDEVEERIRQCATHGDFSDLRHDLFEEIKKIKYAKEIDEIRARLKLVEHKLGIGQSRHAAERHTSAEFVGFLEQVVSGCKPHQEIHIILDNLSAHKTSQVEEFLKGSTHVKLRFTPTYSSWLNQVEIWFARLEREVITRGIFTSVQDLSRKLMRYIRVYSKTARPFKWKSSDVRRRILPC